MQGKGGGTSVWAWPIFLKNKSWMIDGVNQWGQQLQLQVSKLKILIRQLVLIELKSTAGSVGHVSKRQQHINFICERQDLNGK